MGPGLRALRLVLLPPAKLNEVSDLAELCTRPILTCHHMWQPLDSWGRSVRPARPAES